MDTSAAAPRSASRQDRRWLVLTVVAVAQLMTALDATIVNIALPTAQNALGFGDAERQWVVTAYTLCFAGLLLLGGRLADTLGRSRVFLVGLVGFGLGSFVAGSAPDFAMLIAGRAVQGAFAALVAPAALSILAVTFTEPTQRARAFAVFGAVASSGAAAGLLLGGIITEYLDWRWCLFINVVMAAGAVITGRRVLPATPRSGPIGVDVLSAGLATVGLAAIVFGCSRAAETGWGSVVVISAIVAGVAAVSGFMVRQSRAPAPLLPLYLLRDRARGGAYLAVAVAVVGTFGMFLMLTFYLQIVQRYSAALAGVAVLPLAISNALSGYQLGNRLMPRLAPRLLISGGLLVAASGLAVLSRLTAGSGYANVVLPAELLVGIGLGGIFPPAFQLAIRGVGWRDAGVASSLANVATQVGGTIGVAVLNTIAISATAAFSAARPDQSRGAALVHGYTTATAASAGLLAVAAVLIFILAKTSGPSPSPSRAS